MAKLLLLLLCFITVSITWAQSPPVAPALMLTNRDLLPLTPEAASLGRFGNVPVSLYTGVPSVEIPLFTFHTTAVDIPIRLQYHGGGVRLDQKATWVGLGWNLMAGGAVTRVCRGIDDFASGGYVSGAPAVPIRTVSEECGKNRDANTPGFEYVEQLVKGEIDSQADLFSFNFLGYSGSFVLDQGGIPHLTTLQPLRIALTANGWEIITPDGTRCLFEAMELTQPATAGGAAQGVSAWYLTRLTTRFKEQVNFEYGDYNASYEYLPNFPGGGVNSLPTATTAAQFHSCAGLCECGTGVDRSWAYERPGTAIRGKYLRRVSCGPTQMDFFSSADRADGAGLRRLDSMQVTYLPNANRYKRFRLQYAYLSNRLALQSIVEAGHSKAGFEVASPYRFFYHDLVGNTAPGSPSIDRWGYFNAQPNRLPFLPFKDFNVDLPGANRDVDTLAVKFGLLRRIVYPTGGTTDFTFESNDFSNLPPSEFYSDSAPIYETVCASNPDPPTGMPTCGALATTQTLRLTHPQRVTFEWYITDDGNPVSDVDVDGTITDSLGVCARCPSLHYSLDRLTGRPLPISAFLPAGTYYLAIRVTQSRYLQAALNYSYVRRRFSPFRGKPGGGTRIKRIVSYDGLDHRRDQVKEYYYRDDANTHSTGKLSHDLAFATWVDKYRFNDQQGLSRCRYLQRSAQDSRSGSGTSAPVEVGYDTVTVIQRANGQVIKSQSVFTNAAPSVVSLGNNESVLSAAAFPANSFEQNGRLLRELAWQVSSGGNEWRTSDCQLVKRLDNFYQDSVTYRTRNLVVGGSTEGFYAQYPVPCSGVNSAHYYTDSYWSPLVKRVETLFGQQANVPLVTVTRWGYKRILPGQPSWEEQRTSSGGVLLQRFKYPADYDSSVGSAGALESSSMRTTPLEQQSWLRPDSAAALSWTGGTVTSYGTTAGGGAVPQQVFQAALSTPQRNVRELLDATGTYLSLVADPAYQLRANYAYDVSGELAQQHLTGQPATAYLWGYDRHHLVASAHNASQSTIAFTSFEPSATGRWQFDTTATRYVAAKFTGTRGYQLDGTPAATVRCADLTAGEYELWFWSHGLNVPRVSGALRQRDEQVAVVGPWHQHRVRLTLAANATVQLTSSQDKLVWLDELRLYPVGARLTSYTHDPLAGITSQTGPDGRTVFYEYDGLGRLVRTRDEQGRILSQQQYHYVGK